MVATVADFWARVDVGEPDDCWLWLGSTNGSNGYGRLGRRPTWHLAHRYAYEQAVGPIPEGLVLDHLCSVRLCCNPAHLEPVTQAENLARCRANRERAA